MHRSRPAPTSSRPRPARARPERARQRLPSWPSGSPQPAGRGAQGQRWGPGGARRDRLPRDGSSDARHRLADPRDLPDRGIHPAGSPCGGALTPKEHTAAIPSGACRALYHPRMPPYKEQGIVLRSMKLGEADKIVTILDPGARGRCGRSPRGIARRPPVGRRLEPSPRDLMLLGQRIADPITQAEDPVAPPSDPRRPLAVAPPPRRWSRPSTRSLRSTSATCRWSSATLSTASTIESAAANSEVGSRRRWGDQDLGLRDGVERSSAPIEHQVDVGEGLEPAPNREVVLRTPLATAGAALGERASRSCRPHRASSNAGRSPCLLIGRHARMVAPSMPEGCGVFFRCRARPQGLPAGWTPRSGRSWGLARRCRASLEP